MVVVKLGPKRHWGARVWPKGALGGTGSRERSGWPQPSKGLTPAGKPLGEDTTEDCNPLAFTSPTSGDLTGR